MMPQHHLRTLQMWHTDSINTLRPGWPELLHALALFATTATRFGCRYIRNYFKQVAGFSIRHLLPSTSTLGACMLVSVCLAISSQLFMSHKELVDHGFWRQAGLHVGVGVGCLAVLLLHMFTAERATAQQLLRLRRGDAAAEVKED